MSGWLGSYPDPQERLHLLQCAPLPDVIRRRIVQARSSFGDPGITEALMRLVADLPWDGDLKRCPRRTRSEIRTILDHEHFGMDAAKDWVVDHILTTQLLGSRGGALLLLGPPGVGKTTFIKGIASALGRPSVFIGLAGLDNAFTLRGLAPSYKQPAPGKIVEALREAACLNPVICLDEMDKMGPPSNGDPYAVLVAALDPSTNSAFTDDYLGGPVDLSNVLWVATANRLETIPRPLLDRFDIVHLPGYSLSDKAVILRSFLIPKALERVGADPRAIRFSEEAMAALLQSAFGDVGVRQLTSLVNRVMERTMVARSESRNARTTIVRKADVLSLMPRATAQVPRRRIVPGRATIVLPSHLGHVDAVAVRDPGPDLIIGCGDVSDRHSVEVACTYMRCLLEEGQDPARYRFHVRVSPQGLSAGPAVGTASILALIGTFTHLPFPPDTLVLAELGLFGHLEPLQDTEMRLQLARMAGARRAFVAADDPVDLRKAGRKRGFQIVRVQHIKQVIETVYDVDFEQPQTQGPVASPYL